MRIVSCINKEKTMSPKKEDSKINWKNVIGAVVGVLTLIGGGTYFIPASASQVQQSQPVPQIWVDCEARLSGHIASDSMRWHYTELRIKSLEDAVKVMSDNSKVSREILERHFGGK